MPLWLRLTLFVPAVLLLAGATSVYVYRRGAKVMRLEKRGRRALAAVLVGGPTAMLAARAFEAWLPREVAAGLGVAGGTILLGVWISTVLLWAVDLPFLLGRWMRRAPREALVEDPPPEAPEPEAPPAPLTRRELIRTTATSAALGVGFGASLYGSAFGRHDYDVPEIPVRIPGLRPHLDGYRIVQLSDIHFGTYVGDTERRAAVELVRRARPDLVVLTGDLLDHDAAYAPQLGRLVRSLEGLGARDGVTVIPGNHDYYAGVDAVLGTCEAAGATTLRNDGRVLQGGIALVGVDDVWARRNGYGGGPDLAAALATVPEDLPRVLLCHNPVFFEEARGQVALQLSGHTHGGQVNLGVRPADLVLTYVSGLYREEGSTLYVNRGFGTAGPPARVGAPPEITVAVLTAA
ncbi:MAG: metallophosphoesterase [Sandaracinaceae bacterium]|nr:metallophosphoesterase [Sandaracinaceae bacterium]